MSWKTKILITVVTTGRLFIAQDVRASSHNASSHRNDTISFAFMKLSGYSTALASLYIAQAKCHNGSKQEARKEAQSAALKYIKADKLESFLASTFDDHIRRSFSEYDTNLCDKSEVDRARALAQSLLRQAVAGFQEARYP